MIRGVEFTINPSIKYAEEASIGSKNHRSEWRHSIQYLDDSGSLFKKVSKGCKLVDQIFRSTPLKPFIKPLVSPVATVARRLGQASEIANFYTSAESFFSFVQEGK